MMRDRAASIIIEENKVAVMKRIRGDSIYYVFPGGGIEPGETPEVAAKRETFEELGVEIVIENCFGIVNYEGAQYYFLSTIVKGIFGSGKGEEFRGINPSKGSYEPMWIKIEDLSNRDVRPKEIADKVISTFS